MFQLSTDSTQRLRIYTLGLVPNHAKLSNSKYKFYRHSFKIFECKVSCTHSKSPETKDNYDKIHHISKKHKSVDISNCPIFCMKDVLEESTGWLIDILHSAQMKTHHNIK